MKKLLVTSLALTIAAVSFAQQRQSSREAFLKNQAYSEMQRVLAEVEVVQNNYEDLASRLRRIEGADGSKGLKAEIDSLRAQISDLKREVSSTRSEIVNELTAKIVKLQKMQPSAPAPKPTKIVIGPHKEYVVQSGDTLSFISQAFNTTVRKIKEMNNLKGDNLKVGQKIMVPID